MRTQLFGVLALLFVAVAPAAADKLTARQIVDKVVDRDPFGMMNCQLEGRAVLRDRKNHQRVLVFHMDRLRYKPGLSKTMTRFSKPSDMAGVGFLQTMRDDGDDDRFLYLPDLKKSRRIAGALRNNSFVGTDFSYADLDLRDLRESKAKLLGTEKIGKHKYYKLEVKPTRSDSLYSRFLVWVRTDNFLVFKWEMYDKAKTLLKTYQASEMKRVDGHWYDSKGRITNHREKHTTDLFLDKMTSKKPAADGFTVRNLEKL